VLVNAVLLGPTWLSAALTGTPTPPWISVEAGLIAGGMIFLPRRPWSRAIAWLLAAGVLLTALVWFGDLVFRVSLGRPLDLSLDLYLLDAVRRLALGNMGTLRASTALVLVVGLAVGMAFAIAWVLGPRAKPPSPGDPLGRAALGLVVATLALTTLGLAVEPVALRVAAPAATLVTDQSHYLRETRAERIAFAADLAERPDGRIDVGQPLARLDGAHVVLAYLESYGMAALDDPELEAVVGPRLEAGVARLEAAGLQVVSGRLTSPTLGGQSWYAHGTMLSGLWLENQLRYEIVLASDRENLLDDFGRAGYRTATVMPAITTAWPEADRIGFDEVHTSRTIPYRGPPFYWVTIPDQFTWSFVGDLLADGRGPRFVEAGMVSSHAPWTPVLPLIEWDGLGDGSVFEPYRQDGYPPEEIWWDVDVLRDGYARSIAYSLEAAVEFAERYMDDRTLLIVSGDHQAAPWVTGAEGADVPVHVIARDPALVGPFLDWGFRHGAAPGGPLSAHRMDAFRQWFVEAYSGER
jgi:hypothetical protein